MKLLKVLIGAALLAGAIGLVSGDEVAAAECSNNARAYCNKSERRAYDLCMNTGEPALRGAIWFNASGNAPNYNGYYSDKVEVDHDATSVQVKIRGSAYSCGNSGTFGVWASQVRPDGSGANDYRLTNLSSSGFYRGNLPGAMRRWSSYAGGHPRGEITATLNVGGIATNNTNGDATQTFIVKLYRCFSLNGSSIDGGCYPEDIEVTVVRKRIPSQYSLEPSISIDKAVVEPSDLVQVDYGVQKTGSDPSGPTLWRVTRMEYNPAVTVGLSPTDTGAPCSSFDASGRSSCEVFEVHEEVVFTRSNTTRRSSYSVPDDKAVGTRICFVTSVRRPTHAASPVWRHSAMQCMVVSKKPKVQVWGGDVRSGGKIETSLSSVSNTMTYGSWGEYAALSIGSNGGFATGAGLNSGSSSSTQSSWSALTFKNTGSEGGCSFGCYNFLLTSDKFIGQFRSDASHQSVSGTVVLDSMAGGIYQASNLRLAATTIGRGKTIEIIATGTVTIEGDITYDDSTPYTNIRDIPQVIIRAPVINIEGSVRRVDAWLLAVAEKDAGVLTTCSYDGGNAIALTDPLTANICSYQLVINGPVVADTVYLRRTGGSGAQSDQRGEPAEVFNLRADAYLWASTYGSGMNRVQTVHTKELAPRF